MAAQIGSLRVTLGASTANFEAGMKRARREAQTSATAIQRSLTGIKTGIGGLATGLVAGLGVGAIADLAKRSLDYAASLGEVAQQLGISSEALQVYRYAASQVGVTNEQMDTSLAKLTRSAGDAAAGVKAPAEAFNKLGVNVQDVNGKVKDTDRLMREVADGLSKIEDPARRAAIEVDLFGRAGQKLDTLLAGGSKAIDDLREAAHKLGIVLSEDQIQKADETADKLAALHQVLEARIAGTVADNADSIYELAASLGTLAVQAAAALGSWLKFTQAFNGNSVQGLVAAIGSRIIRGSSGEVGVGQLGTSVSGGLGPIKPFQAPSAAGLNRIAGGSKKGGGRSAESIAAELERKRVEALREAYDRQRSISDAKADELRAQQDLLTDYVDRAEIERQLIDIEADQTNKSLELAVAIDASYAPVAERLKEYNEQLRILKKQRVGQEVELDRQRDFERTQDAVFGIQRDLLQAQSQLAETARERREIELQILDLAYRERRERLERIIQQSKDEEERKRAEMELRSLPAQRAADTAGLLQSTRGPLEQYQAGLPTTAAKMNEALQSVAVNGLQALEDGILSVIDGTKSLGAAFRDMASQIIADLLRIQIQKMIIGPLSNLLGGALGGGGLGGLLGGASGGGDLMFGSVNLTQSSLMGFPGSGFASGGFTGFMPRKKVAGFVHGQEYVFDAAATNRIGVGNLERIRKGLPAGGAVRGGDTNNYSMPIQMPPGTTPKQAREIGDQFAAGFQHRIAIAKRKGF